MLRPSGINRSLLGNILFWFLLYAYEVKCLMWISIAQYFIPTVCCSSPLKSHNCPMFQKNCRRTNWEIHNKEFTATVMPFSWVWTLTCVHTKKFYKLHFLWKFYILPDKGFHTVFHITYNWPKLFVSSKP